MRNLPTLATERQLQEIFGVPPDTTRRWKQQGLTKVGSYTPPGAAPAPLYAVSDTAKFRRLEP